ncbi:1-deoxy-D-xylulose-5-phosphate reductoisomerase [Saxibacter everestensis]|uniref:1-deoxy-D-xylulose 5-phosphate reductoisomerase n=1 Tax=Saxibacter everestensis TaxID=2909229 RepID=A0ABY8QVM7_9MICO|nr:1-deoxy-D-xylulose-5-phosphate reductoisomerase [Brevibacteriaceae bacterium ZFBP1038]
MNIRNIVLLGSTGSVGTQAIEVVEANPERFRIIALSAGSNLSLLAEQAVTLGVDAVALAASPPGGVGEVREAIAAAAGRLGTAVPQPEILLGERAAADLAATSCDMVLNAITGSVGLEPTLAALARGTDVALANKESLIVGGQLVLDAAQRNGASLIPVDSEHSAIAQALRSGSPEEVQRLVLTASGGPFRGYSAEQLADVTPAQALVHPTWDMGRVITTNSATLVNKGLEVIEAHLLFGIPFERIDVVIHPQSQIHSMVQFVDGSTIAQVSPPDMKLPIALALGWPRRVPGSVTPNDWSSPANWTFEPVDDAAFPALQLARKVGTAGATFPAVFNAANEECVEAFHQGRLSFVDIVRATADIVAEHVPDDELTLDGVLAAEKWARTQVGRRLR